jgi:uroporphyrinogen-III decarboxylase
LIGIGDPAASLTGPALFRDFVLPYQQRLVDALRAAGAAVRLHICGNTRRILPSLATLGCDIVDIDSLVPLETARSAFGPETLLLGGLDPVRVLQNGSPTDVARAAEACFRLAGPRYILGAGCEVPPHTPPENLHALAAVARSSR